MASFQLCRSVFALVLSALAISAPGDASAAASTNVVPAEKELRALHEKWAVARIDGDVAFLETFYAPELRLQVMDGSVVSRADDIAMFDRVGKDDAEVIKPEFIHDDDVEVTFFGDAAIVTGVESLRGTARGHYGEMALRFTNVLVCRDGRWQLVLHQSTRIQQAPRTARND